MSLLKLGSLEYILSSWLVLLPNSTGLKCGQTLTDEQVNAMDLSTKVDYLKRNPVTVARQLDYVLKQLWGKVILSGMHTIGQILNFDDRREFQNRGTEHKHAPVHIADAPKIDENEDS